MRLSAKLISNLLRLSTRLGHIAEHIRRHWPATRCCVGESHPAVAAAVQSLVPAALE